MRNTIVILFCLSVSLSAQSPKDSLLEVLADAPKDSNRVYILAALGASYRMGLNDSMFLFTNQAVELAKQLHYTRGYIYSLNALGLAYHIKGDYNQARASYYQALKMGQEQDHTSLEGNIYGNLGRTYYRMGEVDSAFQAYIQAEKAFRRIGDPFEIWKVYQGLGGILNEWGEVSKAAEYLEKAFAIVEGGGKRMDEGYLIYELGNFYFQNEQYEKYMDFAEKWRAFKGDRFSEGMLSVSPQHITLNFLFSRDDSLTIRRLQDGIAYFERTDNKLRIAYVAEDLAIMYYNTRQYQKALDALDLADRNYQILEDQVKLAFVRKLRYLTLKELGNTAGALQELEDYNQLRDSIRTIAQQKNLAELQVKYETDKKEQALKIKELEVQQRTLQRNILLGSSFLLAIMGGLIFYGQRQRMRTSQELARRDAEIQSQRIHQLEQEKQLLSFSSMIEGQEKERMRIAKDLHDGLGGLLTTAKAHFTAIEDEMNKLATLNLYQRTNQLIDEACVEVRRISQNMMPRALMLYGLKGAIEDLATHLRTNKVQCKLEIIGLKKELDKSRAVMLFRILQELINNILKHAQAQNVLIQLIETADGTSVIVEDDGTGFNYEKARQQESLGMSSIESRVNFLQGSLEVDSVVGEGTTIAIWLPK